MAPFYGINQKAQLLWVLLSYLHSDYSNTFCCVWSCVCKYTETHMQARGQILVLCHEHCWLFCVLGVFLLLWLLLFYPFKTWSPLFLNLASHLGSLREPQRSICLCLLGAHTNTTISGCSMWYYRSNIWSSSLYDKPYYSNTAHSCFQFSMSFCASNPRGLGEKALSAKCLPRKHDSSIQISRIRKTLGTDCRPAILAWSSFSLNWMDELWVQRNSFWKKNKGKGNQEKTPDINLRPPPNVHTHTYTTTTTHTHTIPDTSGQNSNYVAHSLFPCKVLKRS